ncbi:TIGR02147 family protein [Bdellovibrio sp. HCB274]|uniref:TIGR02147 family protein n=1 Tax=Bdellovibrio sp. HCB274 TaxID=3394361 RepID=UPI0039B3F953
MEVAVQLKPISKYPEIARYTCYRAFLRDFFEYKKSLRSGFSYRQFANLVGLKSPNYLQLVIQEKRNLTETTGRRLAEALKLNAKEVSYFEALIRLQNAENDEERTKAQKNVHACLKKLLAQFVQLDASEILNKWYHLLVREMVLLKGFEPSGEYISKKMNGIISVEEAERSLKFLLNSGYLKNNGETYEQSEPVLDTGIDIFNHDFMQEYHAQTMKAWSTNITQLGYENQELGLLNIPLPKNKLGELQEKIRQFQDEIIGWSQSQKDCDELVQLGTYLMHFETKK